MGINSLQVFVDGVILTSTALNQLSTDVILGRHQLGQSRRQFFSFEVNTVTPVSLPFVDQGYSDESGNSYWTDTASGGYFSVTSAQGHTHVGYAAGFNAFLTSEANSYISCRVDMTGTGNSLRGQYVDISSGALGDLFATRYVGITGSVLFTGGNQDLRLKIETSVNSVVISGGFASLYLPTANY